MKPVILKLKLVILIFIMQQRGLVEKWFLVAHFKEKGFALQTEKSYYQNLQDYYNNLRKTGFEYEDTDFSKAINFMLMSSKTIIINNK